MGFFAGGFDYSVVKANASHIPVQWITIIIFAIVIGLGVKLVGSTFDFIYSYHMHMQKHPRRSRHYYSCDDWNWCLWLTSSLDGYIRPEIVLSIAFTSTFGDWLQ